MTNYTQMDPLALNRLAAERAGHILAPEDENLGGDYFIVVSKEQAVYSKSAPDDEYDLTHYGYGPDYTGSVDAALMLIPLGTPVELTNDWDLQQGTTEWMADVRGHYAIHTSLVTAIVCAWLVWQDALAGKGEG